MKILILSAMDKEQSLLLSEMGETEKMDVNGVTAYRGTIGGHDVYAAKCGIGKVNSALNTYRLIEGISPDFVVNSGVAGGVDGALGVGTVLIPTHVAHHDVWCGPGTNYGAADGYDRYFLPDEAFIEKGKDIFKEDASVNFGLICSGDKFIHQVEEVEEIKRNFPEAKAVDMESASISQTCTMMGVPFAIVRVMSDTPGAEENISQYENFWGEAPERTFRCLVKLIGEL